jgi:hypothetical protein
MWLIYHMKARIIHSLLPSGAYTLKVGERECAIAQKSDDGFSVVDGEAFLLINELTYPTMSALKVAVDNVLGQEWGVPTKTKRMAITLFQIRKVIDSHSRTTGVLKEAYKTWPERAKDKQWIHGFVMRNHMEGLAATGWSPAQRWLNDHPTIGRYDKKEYIRRIEREYGRQPAWTKDLTIPAPSGLGWSTRRP